MRPSPRVGVPASRQLASDPERVDEDQLSSILSAVSSALTATSASILLSPSTSRTVVPTSTRTVHLTGVTALSETLTITDSVVATAPVTDQSTDIDDDDVTTVSLVSIPATSSLGSAAAALATGEVALVSNRLGLTLPTAPAVLGSRADELTTVTIADSVTSTGISSASQIGPVVLDPTYIEFTTPVVLSTTTITGPTTTLGAVIDSRPGVGFTIIDPLTGADATQQDAGGALTIIGGGPGIITVTGVSADPGVVTVASLTAGASVITVTPVPPGPSLITVLPAPQDPVVFTSTPAQGLPSVITVLPAAAPSVVTILPAPAVPVVTTSFVLAPPSPRLGWTLSQSLPR